MLMETTGQGRIIVDLLTEIERFRALTEAESRLLERIIRYTEVKHGARRFWSHQEDALLRKLIAKGWTAIAIAQRMERTPDAVRTRIKVMRRKPNNAQVRARVRGNRV